MRKVNPVKPRKLDAGHLVTVDPMTQGQEVVFEAYKSGSHLVLSGSAGTGKTFSALYLALEEVLDKSNNMRRRQYSPSQLHI